MKTYRIKTNDGWVGKVQGENLFEALKQALCDYKLLLPSQIISIKEV